MPAYVDGFLIPIAKDKIADYRQMAELGRQVWMEHGALDYRECLSDDLNPAFGVPFPKAINASADETIILAWITYTSREDRDRINAAVMADPRMHPDETKPMPFDCARMIYGGFQTLVGD
jgi:uncharacterized protein YbaA (DUF1428 family)